MSFNKDCHESMFSIVNIVISVSNVTSQSVVFVTVFVFVFVVFCQVISPHHTGQIYKRSQVSRIALWWSSLNVFVSVSVFVFVFVIVSTSVYFLNHLTPHAWVSSWRLLLQPEPNSVAHPPFKQTMHFLVRVGLSYFTTNKRKQDCFWPDPEHINQQNKALMHWSYFWTCPELGQKSK